MINNVNNGIKGLMSTSAISYAEAPAVSLQELAGRETLLQRSIRRAHIVPRIAGQIGLANTLRMIRDVSFSGTRVESDITVSQTKLFREPIHMTTSSADVATLLEIADRQVYKLPQNLAERVGDRPVVDIGAHIGLAAVYFANRFTESRVVSFEPNPRNYDYLLANSTAYNGQIEAVNAAVASQPGYAAGRAAGRTENHVTRIYQASPSAGQEAVWAWSPEEIVQGVNEDIGLLKVDIEGAEKDLFGSGAMDELLDTTQVMLVETHDMYQPGSAQAVHEAALRSKMELYGDNGHTTIYSRV